MIKKNFSSFFRLPIALHIIAWLIIMILPRYLIYTYGDGNQEFLNHHYITLAFFGILFYLNYLWLVPIFFFKGRKTTYFLLAVTLLVLVCFGIWYVNEYLLFDKEKFREISQMLKDLDGNKEFLKPPLRQFKIIDNFYTSILILGFSLGLKLLEKVSLDEKKRKELEKEKLNSELAFLKNQINPHFFFNTLNNIYALIISDQEKAQNSVLELSKLMRYLLYESEKGETKLIDEITFMNHYIDLMKLRLNQKVILSVKLPEPPPDINIPALLFIPFIENAFKHGVSYRNPSFIEIRMDANNKIIQFNIRNSKVNNKVNKEYSGIGLDNVKKRLNLLFPNRYNLEIRENEDEFAVELLLNLDEKN